MDEEEKTKLKKELEKIKVEPEELGKVSSTAAQKLRKRLAEVKKD